MNDVTDHRTVREPKSGTAEPAVALALGSASRDKADSFLDEQRRLARLQAEELLRENRVRHWSLRVRHVSDVIKLAFEVAVAFIVLALAVGLGATIWSATNADGLIIESFNVPQSMVAHGLTGQVVANKLLDRLTFMQNATRSTRAASTFANDWTSNIKVEIPDTGISLGEAVRYLRMALGREKHLSGEMYDTSNGIVLTTRLEGETGETFEGKADELNGIVTRAAEAIFREAQPYRYSVYLANEGRFRESIEVERASAKSGNSDERAWAYNGLAVRYEIQGEYKRAEDYARRALSANPLLPNPMAVIGFVESRRGHDEAALSADRRTIELYRGAGTRDVDPAIVYPARLFSAIRAKELKGDYRRAFDDRQSLAPVRGLVAAADIVTGGAIDSAMAHDPRRVREALAELTPVELATSQGSYVPSAIADYAQGLAAIDQFDWSSAVSAFKRSEAEAQAYAISTKGAFSDRHIREVLNGPWLAYAAAMAGDGSRADAVLRTLPPDCDVCTRMRGRIAAMRHDWRAAEHWFAMVSARAPSIPFADTDWGAMLLHKGDVDGAIAKFESAHAKGPHFADPLEMWGEALMQKNRSDLAFAKFEEANNYAPNWGHLHLKWGEALYYAGKKDEAKKQFAVASRLALGSADAAALGRAGVRHD